PDSLDRSGRCSASYSSLKSASRCGSMSIITQNTYGVFPVRAAAPPTHSYTARWRFIVCGRISPGQRPASPAAFHAALSRTAAAEEPEALDRGGRVVAVVGPQREVGIARLDRLALDGGPHEGVVQDDVELKVAAQAVPDPGKIEGRPRDFLEAQDVRVELAGLGDVGHGDAHVRELLEETHGVLLRGAQTRGSSASRSRSP